MLTPGTVTKGYIFVCLRCRTQEVLVSSTQAKAEKYARSREIGWSKKELGGWHCPSCKHIKPNEAELILARMTAEHPEVFKKGEGRR